jgi:SagB-type dehydrogenase family enzyme
MIVPDREILAEDFHVASRNARSYKRMYAAHDVHYAPHVQKLVAESPMRLPGPRHRLSLPRPAVVTMELGAAIRGRRSRRDFAPGTLPLDLLSAVLRLGNGVGSTHEADGRTVSYQRAAANSGGLGSVEVYPVVLDVESVNPGIYHYDSVSHELVLLRDGDFREWLREVVFFQLEFSDAAVALILTGAVGRLRAKYGLRGYRFALLDAGHVSENIYLLATALELQVSATAGFIDDDVDAALGIDGLEDASLLVLLVGPGAGFRQVPGR